jgi:transitional endoplasmic reticulum ATPase
VAPQRTGDADNDHKNEEVAEFLNQLNSCAQKNVFVIGTTNYPQQLDPALIRSGRMNGKIYVGAPDQKSRQQLFQHFMAKRKPEVVDSSNLDFGKLADKTKGYSNADIEEVVNQASRQAFKQRAKISGASFEQALKTVKPSINDGVARDYQRLMEKFQPEEMSFELKHFYGMI